MSKTTAGVTFNRSSLAALSRWPERRATSASDPKPTSGTKNIHQMMHLTFDTLPLALVGFLIVL
jgi:hypothetical protein